MCTVIFWEQTDVKVRWIFFFLKLTLGQKLLTTVIHPADKNDCTLGFKCILYFMCVHVCIVWLMWCWHDTHFVPCNPYLLLSLILVLQSSLKYLHTKGKFYFQYWFLKSFAAMDPFQCKKFPYLVIASHQDVWNFERLTLLFMKPNPVMFHLHHIKRKFSAFTASAVRFQLSLFIVVTPL